MKILKLALVFILLFVMLGCGMATKNADWAKHDVLYRDYDHWEFSWYGWRAPTADDVNNSNTNQWWGKEIEVKNVK